MLRAPLRLYGKYLKTSGLKRVGEKCEFSNVCNDITNKSISKNRFFLCSFCKAVVLIIYQQMAQLHSKCLINNFRKRKYF